MMDNKGKFKIRYQYHPAFKNNMIKVEQAKIQNFTQRRGQAGPVAQVGEAPCS